MIQFKSKCGEEKCEQCGSKEFPFYLNDYGYYYCMMCCMKFEILEWEDPEGEKSLIDKVLGFFLRHYGNDYDEVD